VALQSGIRFTTPGYVCPQHNHAIVLEKHPRYEERVVVASMIDGVQQVTSAPLERSRDMTSGVTPAVLEQVLATGAAGLAPLRHTPKARSREATRDGQPAHGYRLKPPLYLVVALRQGAAVPLAPSDSGDTDRGTSREERPEAAPAGGMTALSYAAALEELHRRRLAYPHERWRIVPYQKGEA
jgi:hypothetical protein